MPDTIVIAPEDQPYEYRLSVYEFHARRNEGVRREHWEGAGATAEMFTWDALLKNAWEGLPGGIVSGATGAIVGAIIDKIVGTDKWQEEVTGQLTVIIQKLDEILSEIRALREYLRDDRRAEWRSEMQALVTTDIQSLSARLAAVHTDGKLFEANRQIINQLQLALEQTIGRLSNKLDPHTGRPEGIPFYAGIVASWILLFEAKMLAGERPAATAQLLRNYQTLFEGWEKILNENLHSKNAIALPEVEFFRNFPKRGWVGTSLVNFMPSIDRSLLTLEKQNAVFGVIEGGLEAPYRFVRLDLESYALPTTIAKFKNGLPDQFPTPYNQAFAGLAFAKGLSDITAGDTAAVRLPLQFATENELIFLANQMCNDLNTRRSRLIEELEGIRKLQMVQKAIKENAMRFGELANVIDPER